MRNISDVITKMQDIALGNDGPVFDSLEHVKKSAMFTAPEQMYVRWEQIHDIICDKFPEQPNSF